jgi:hypothetical protein
LEAKIRGTIRFVDSGRDDGLERADVADDRANLTVELQQVVPRGARDRGAAADAEMSAAVMIVGMEPGRRRIGA